MTVSMPNLSRDSYAISDDPLDIPSSGPGNRWTLHDPRLALKVVEGHIDIFAYLVSENTGGAGRRHHLFRVGKDEIAFGLSDGAGLPNGLNLPTERLVILAVGGRDTEVVALNRAGVRDLSRVEAWIALLCGVVSATTNEWQTRNAEVGSVMEIAPGERLYAPSHGVAWITVKRGNVEIAGSAEPFGTTSPPWPLGAGMWMEAPDGATVLPRHGIELHVTELWSAMDRFHIVAMANIRLILRGVAEAESQRIALKEELTTAKRQELVTTLAAMVVPRQRGDESVPAITADPLLAACQAVGGASGVSIVSPSHRQPLQCEFSDIFEIARASKLRVRRTLLRPDWWRYTTGPLVGWLQSSGQPVAIIPDGRHRYSLIEGRTGNRRSIDAATSLDLSPEAAMFYVPLPSQPLSAGNLLAFCMRLVRADSLRILVAAFVMAALTVAAPLITELLIDSVIPRSELDQLAFCAAALLAVAIGTAIFQLVQSVAMLRLEGLVDWKLQAAILDRLLRLPLSFFKSYAAGDLTDRTLGIETIRRVLTGRTIRGLLAGLFCLFSFGVMAYLNFHLTLIAGGLVFLRITIIAATALVRLGHERRHFDARGKVDGLVLQLLVGIGKLRVAFGTIRALAVWAKCFADQKSHFIASRRAANVLGVIEAAFPTLALLIIFAEAERQTIGHLSSDLGRFLAFMLAFGQSIAATGEWGSAIGESLIAIPLFSRVKPLLTQQAEIADDSKQPGQLSGAIELAKVTFRYRSDFPPALNNLSLRVKQADYVAIVGPSGSGKSTIFRLLLGFEVSEAGGVFYDGNAVSSLDLSAVRRQIGVVLQNGKLVSGSLYENICGGLQLPIEQVWDAARLAGLAADIEAMPMGMHTEVAEGVSTLSGGQRQRLMIARALVTQPRILLLDEATSALDNQTQAVVGASLANLRVTRLVIAHRLSTVRNADRIVVLDGGQVVQEGTFEELSGVPGMFADLAARQLL